MRKQLLLICLVFLLGIVTNDFYNRMHSVKPTTVNTTRILPKDTMRIDPEMAEYMRQTEGFTLADYIKHPQFLPVLNSHKVESEYGFNKCYSQYDYESSMAFVQSTPIDYTLKAKPLPKNLYANGSGLKGPHKFSNDASYFYKK